MAVNPLYVLQSSLEEIFVNKQTGLPLANGTVTFYKDNQRNALKTIYELSGAPPNYTYSPLPNPMTLSIVGTPQNAVGDNVVIYYYPYDDFDPPSLETYYVVVEDENGVEQFTRENWPFPNVGGEGSPAGGNASGDFNNEISNSQFVDVFFNPLYGVTLTVSGNSVTEFDIAPDWKLRVTHTGAGSIVVNRTSNAGNSGYATNAPYNITFNASGSITALKLYQRLTHNPNIWSPILAGSKGYVATSIMLQPGTSLTVAYEPNVGTAQNLLAANNLTGLYTAFANTTQLITGNNPTTSVEGYVDISIYLPVSGASGLSSVQVLGLDTNILNVPYEQQPVNRQKDYLFHYYNALLQYKPIPSYLDGWDFPMNPCQFLGSTVGVQATGANKSFYCWDQTIVFQEINNGVSVSRETNGGGLKLTAQQTGRFAIIQYLDQAKAREILNGKASVFISGLTSAAAGLNGTITLWATTDANLPDLNSPTFNSGVVSLAGNGRPTMGNGVTWTEVPRSNRGDAVFELAPPVSDYMFSGWALNGAAPQYTATFFAIVVGFETVTSGDSITINSIGLCAGDIATRPAPLTVGETQRNLERYYFKTFTAGTIPAQNAGINTGCLEWQLISTGRATFYSAFYPTEMRANPSVVIYNPAATNSSIRNLSAPGDCGNSIVSANSNTKMLCIEAPSANFPGGSGVGDLLQAHVTADARLGIVN